MRTSISIRFIHVLGNRTNGGKMNIRKIMLMLTVCVTVLGLALTAQAQGRSDQAVAQARSYFRANGRILGLADPDRELVVRQVRDHGDQFVVRFDQFFRGVKVFEGEAIARVSASGVDITNALRANLSIDTNPGIGSGQALATALRAIGVRGETSNSSELQILPQGQRSGRDVLVWHVHVEADNDLDEPGEWEYFVDARTGAVVWSFNSLHATSATGKTMYSGDVTLDVTFNGSTYSLVNPGQGAAPGNSTNNMKNRQVGKGTVFTSSTPTFGDNNINNTDPNTAGADAHYGLANTWSFYQATFGRNGIDGSGRKTYQRVHYKRNYGNAN